MSATDPIGRRLRRLINRLRGDERGAATAVEFAIVLPALLGLSFAILDFTLVAFDYHRAGEATRRGARLAAIVPPVIDLQGLQPGDAAVCLSGTAGPSCGGATIAASESFGAVVTAMQEILPEISAANVRITYRLSDIGDSSTPGGLLPLTTVEVIDVQHEFLLLDALPGLSDGITLPPHATTYLGSGPDLTSS
jgi:hypothetical protein